MILNDEYIVNIEKMLNEGAGLARIDDFPVFVDDSVPQDVLKVKISKLNKNYAKGVITEIITPSKYRIKPLCPVNSVCGSCNWLHIDYCEQLNQKRQIVFETIKNITGHEFFVNPVIQSPKITDYRCKVQYPVSQKKSGRIIAGYYKKSSHDLVNIKYCPMHSPEISEILEYIKIQAQQLGISGYDEIHHKGLLRHVIFRKSSYLEQILVIFVINQNFTDKTLEKLASLLLDKYQKITGVCANFNTNKSNVILGKKTQVICGNDFYTEKLSDITYNISVNSFFQVNPYSAEIIFDIVKDLIASKIEKPVVLDAYSGVSSFGIWLSSISSKVVSVEEVRSASNDAVKNAEINNIKNLEVINADASEIFADFIKNNLKFDVVLMDPPRKGSSPEALEYIVKLSDKYIIYVSCNPATLARDLKYLLENNFVPEYIQPVDMFPNTSHVETVVLLSKKNGEK